MNKHAVIYVPGIGDDVKGLQGALIKKWRLYGVEPIMHEMPWMDQQPFAPKLERLLVLIDDLHTQGKQVSLVGASAGAGAVINAFAARKDKVHGVVCIAGKVNNPESIGKRYRLTSPAFIESAYLVQTSLDQLDFETDRTRIWSRYALFDGIVPVEDSRVVGGNNKTVPSIGHAITITTQLIFGAHAYLRQLKRM